MPNEHETAPEREPQRPAGISLHILPTSATMVGVCMTMVGLVKLMEVRAGPSHVDEIFAIDALGFLASALASYVAIRQNHRHWEQIADVIFVLALIAMAVGGGFFAFELI
jgi:multisubunit Na+/H+ antiporter MnhF subunit